MNNRQPIVIEANRAVPSVKRVAAYCRVSSPSQEQLNSYQAQIDNYEKKFAGDDSIIFAGVYGDPGVSGTQAEKREGFMRMIEDCRHGQIDAIWTKSVSRFGRNTVDTLIYTRELRNLGIDVYFEKENIHSLEPDGELLLTLMAAFAESEAFNMSENIKWGKHRRYEKGLVESIPLGMMLGFRQNKGIVTVVEEEAEIVRRIFREYLDGYNMDEIADHLTKEALKTRTGIFEWSSCVVRRILINEKYAGDCLFQKTFIVDPISHRSVPNRGEYNQYFVEGCYPAFVGKDEWLTAQEMIKRNGTERKNGSEEYPFVGKMYCSVCGKAFNTAPTTRTGRVVISQYRCISRRDHTALEVPGMTYVRPHTVRYTKNPTPALLEYRERYCKKPEPRPYLCSDTRIDIDRPEKAFLQAWNSILRRKQRYLPVLNGLVSSDEVYTRYHASVLIGIIDECEKLADFSPRLFRKTVERIDVQPTGKLTFTFKAGIKITV